MRSGGGGAAGRGGRGGSSGKGGAGKQNSREPNIRRIPAPQFGYPIMVTLRVQKGQGQGCLFAFRNPERVYFPILVTGVTTVIHQPSKWLSDISVGTHRAACSSDNLLKLIAGHFPAETVQGESRHLIVDRNDWFTITCVEGDAEGLVMDVFFDYRLMRGGSGAR